MISFTNVSKVYAKQAVLDILLLEISKGQTFGLVGNNVNKSVTYLRM